MPYQILVVDDDAAVRDVIRLQLDGTRYAVLEAEDGKAAITCLEENARTVDAIVCDVRMPKLNGVEAVAHFRRAFPDTPVIVLTGLPDAGLAADFLEQGVIDYLVKPVEKATLIAAVDKAVAWRSLHRGTGDRTR